MTRLLTIWTWDRGRRPVDMEGAPESLAPILETVLNGCLWEELEKFPPITVERLLPRVNVPRNIRRLVEIWIEEKRRPAARATALAGPRSRARRAKQSRA